MRVLDRLISFVFSVIMLVLSVVLILVGVGVVEPQMIIDMINEHVFVEEMIAANIFNTLTIVGIVLFLASLKTTIFLSLFKIKDKSPILVKTKNGEVEIAQETITSAVRSIGTSFESIKDVQAKMVKKRRGVVIYAMVMVYANSNIKEITEELQKQVKEVVKSMTGVTVLEVNIKVKNIYQKSKKNGEAPETIVSQQTNAEKEEVVAEPVVEEVEEIKEEVVEENIESEVTTEDNQETEEKEEVVTEK